MALSKSTARRFLQIIIRGPSEDVAKAKQQLLDLAAEKQISSYTLEVRANPDHHKFLIGKSGSRIKKVLKWLRDSRVGGENIIIAP